MKKLISVVVPCYNEAECITLFYEELVKVSKDLKNELEIIFVNDGSSDTTLLKIKKLANKDKRVKYISFSRNFGKEAAMLAGLDASKGDYITTMDVDLQDPPSLLIKMIEIIEEGEYDCVAARSISMHGYSFFRKMLTKFYYKIINKISKIEIVEGARDFRLMTRQMVNAILKLREYNRYSKGIFSWVGFNTKWLTYENTERVAGTTKWNFEKLFSYSLESIMSFSTIPFSNILLGGVIFFIISFIMMIVIVIKTLILKNPLSSWLSLICIIFFIIGIQLFCLGIIGQYLAKIYLEIKNRPIYVIKETNVGEQYEKKFLE